MVHFRRGRFAKFGIVNSRPADKMPKEFTGWDNNSTNARPGFSRAVGRSLVPGRSGSGERPRASPGIPPRLSPNNCETQLRVFARDRPTRVAPF